ncbi:MAG TPA: ATP-binding cassette domain-containing protein [Thermoanaerobaculia bacterium]|nr:ATP-binding cassette domain-containing protein [Thermoanaerobaculia bacterium]
MSVLSVSGLSKKYCRSLRRGLWYGVQDIVREVLPIAPPSGLRRDEFWAVDDVSFELARGEALAVIGRNGAGKSTVLKVLAGLLKPDRGEVRLRGRAQALIELGIGFDPLLTGRENVRVGAALHGLDRRATGELQEKVLEFAELEEFFDAPMQSYSSGMRARLAYALAANLQSEVLMVDEVLAVGDAVFQRKCVTHMLSYLNGGGALLFVSHSPYQVQSLCERGVLLSHGRVSFRGSAVDALNEMLNDPRRPDAEPEAARYRAPAIGPVTIEEIHATAVHGEMIRTGEPVRITVRYRAEERVEVWWGFGVWTADQWVHIASEYDLRARTLEAGVGELSCVLPRLPLVGSRYTLRAAIMDARTRTALAHYGFQDAPEWLDVRSEASLLANGQLATHALVTLDVDWD